MGRTATKALTHILKKSSKPLTPKKIIDAPETKIPFTCKITNKYEGGAIKNLYLMIDENILMSIPISNQVAETIDKGLTKKITNFITQELKSHI